MGKFKDLEYGVRFSLDRISDKNSYEEISAEMHVIRNDIIKLIEKGEEDLESVKKYKELMGQIIEIAQVLYNYSGLDTGLTDSEYDRLYEMYKELGGEEIIGAPLPEDSENVEHHRYITLRGTLSKVYYLKDTDGKKVNKSRKSLSDWVKSKNKLLKENDCFSNLWDEDVYVFPKWDGVSCIFEFNPDGSLNKALTRGDTERNEAKNITNAVKDLVRGRKTDNGYGLKTEIVMTEDNLAYFNEKYNTRYKNTRSIVSSILNSDEVDERNELLKVVPLRISKLDAFGEEQLQELAPEALSDFPFIQCKLSEVDKIETFAINHRYVDGIRCDGVVIYIIDKSIRNILGRSDDKNNYEVAYKFTEETGITIVEDIDFRMGVFGTVTPVVKVSPIKLKGNTITNVSISNYERFKTLNLSKGDEVKILYDIVPYLIVDNDCRKSNNPPIEFITHCPECGGEIEISDTNKTARCTNSKCRSLEKGRILNYINKLDIHYIDARTLETFYNAGVIKTIKDLYTFTKKKKKLQDLDGIGEITIKNIAKSVKEKSDKIEIYRLFGAIGIPNIGVETFKNVFKVLSYDELMEVCEDKSVLRLSNIKGISDITARRIINGVNDNIELIEWLVKKLNPTYSFAEANAKFTVCFTKVRNDELEEKIRERGGAVVDSVTKGLSWLIVPSLDVNSSKVEKAKKYKVKIMPINILKQILDNDNASSNDSGFSIKNIENPEVLIDGFNMVDSLQGFPSLLDLIKKDESDKPKEKKKSKKKNINNGKVIDFFTRSLK